MATRLGPESHADVEWVDLHTGRRRDLFCGRAAKILSGEVCEGVRFVHSFAAPGVMPEGFLANHLVVVSLSGPVPFETRWLGEGRRAGHLLPNTAHVFPAGVPFAGSWSRPIETLAVEMTPAFVGATAGEDGARGRVELRPAAAAEDDLLAHAALAIESEVRDGAPAGRLCGESLATALTAHLLRRYAERRPPAQRRPALPKPTLDRVLEYVAAHLEGSLTLRDLAAVSGMNLFRFVRAFRESTGLPPHRYVLLARVERAKALLRDGALSVSEVALRTGFATPSHFATTFRRVTRTSPGAWRRTVL